MSVQSRWTRLDAQKWVHRIGMLQTGLLILMTCGTAFVGLVHGLMWVAVLPGALATLSGWMTSAWREERPWSWWAWSSVSGFGVLTGLSALLESGPSWRLVLGLVFDGVLLALLAHPQSRARIQPAVPPRGDGGVGGPVAMLHRSGD